MKTKTKLSFLLMFFIVFSVSAQENNENSSKLKKKPESSNTVYKKSWSIGAYGGQSLVFGDVNADPMSIGYGLNIQKAVGHTLAFRLQGGMGTAKGVDRKFANSNTIDNNIALNGNMDSKVNFHPASGYLPVVFNYKMKYYNTDLQLLYNFGFHSDYRYKQNPNFDMYMFIGLGGLLYQTFTDQLDANGKLRDYSSIFADYSSGKISQGEVKKQVAGMLDGDYETATEGNPTGAAKSYETVYFNHVFLAGVNMGLGARFKVNSRADIALESKLSYYNNDQLDGQRWSKIDNGVSAFHDVMITTGISVNIRLGRLDNIYWFDNPSAQHYKITLENRRKIALLSSDVDNDGVSDYFDKDLNTPEGVKVDVNGVAIDSDNDGVPDYKDTDLFTDKGAVVDSNGVAIDSDKDGVPDHKDLDPNTPEGQLVNFQGVPIGSRGSASGVSGTSLGFLPAIFFDFDDASLKTESLSAISNVALALKYNPQIRILIIGYTDNTGSAEYNKRLGLKRAQNVADFLKLQGIDAGRIEIEGRGEAEPLTDVKTSDAKRLNRRVQFQIIEGSMKVQSEPVNENTPAPADNFEDIDENIDK